MEENTPTVELLYWPREYHIPSDIRRMVIVLSREIVQEFKPPSFNCTPHGNHLQVFTLKVNCFSRYYINFILSVKKKIY